MRTLIGLFLISTLSGWAHAAAPARFRSELLTYDELVRLSSEKRIRYFNDLANLLVTIEAQTESKEDLMASVGSRERQSLIAQLRLWAELFPSAEAKGLSGGATIQQADYQDLPPERRNVRNLLPRQTTEVGPIPGKDVPNQTRDLTVSAPPAAKPADVPANPAPTNVPANETSSADGPTPTLPGSTGGVPSMSVAPTIPPGATTGGESPAEADKCAPAAPRCPDLNAEARKKLITEFRTSPESDRCITGGYFTKKVWPRKRGSCEMTDSFYFAPKKPDGKLENFGCGSKSMSANMTLCNPALFCVEIGAIEVSPGVKKDAPSSICVPRGPHVTQSCLDKYNDLVSGKRRPDLSNLKNKKFKKNQRAAAESILKQMSKAPARACDPLNVELPALRDQYKLLKEETERQYHALCEKDATTFAKLFCKECEIIRERLHIALHHAGHGCDSPVTAPTPKEPAKSGSMTGQ